MKNLLITLLSVLVVTNIACSSKSSSSKSSENNGQTTGTTPPPSDGYGSSSAPNTSGWGESTPLSLDLEKLQDFTGYEISNIKEARLFVKMQKMTDSNTYYGNVRVYYKYEIKSGNFSTTNKTTTYYKYPKFITGTRSTDVAFNKFYDTSSGTYKFIAFFEEPGTSGTENSFFINEWPRNSDGTVYTNSRRGALILVVDNAGDDLGSGGKLYYHNWTVQNPMPSKPGQYGNPFGGGENIHNRCWYIKAGPYQCRDFIVNDTVNPAANLNNIKTFKLLGSFDVLNIQNAISSN